MLLTSVILKQNSAISLEECVLVFKVFTTATRKLGVSGFVLVFFSHWSSASCVALFCLLWDLSVL